MGLDREMVLLCDCAYTQNLSEDTRVSARKALLKSGRPFQEIPDLCALSAHKDPRLQTWANMPTLTLMACHPRAIRLLFKAGGAPLTEANVSFINLKGMTPAGLLQALHPGHPEREPSDAQSAPDPKEAKVSSAPPSPPDGWLPWFPVLDLERCTGCRQCLNFCIFGVYGEGPDGQIEVKHPEKCKPNCPACARVCPVQAIVFPKYPAAPINGGEGEEVAPPMDVSKLASADVFALLRTRWQNAQRDLAAKALRETKHPSKGGCSCAQKPNDAT